MSKKSKAKERHCLRCFCTDARACNGGCAWVEFSNVCDRCLTQGEMTVYGELMWRLNHAIPAQMDSIKRCLRAFGLYVTTVSGDMPIPFRPTENFTRSRSGRLRSMRKQLKASTDALAAAVKNQKRKDP